jgi:PASTA domain
MANDRSSAAEDRETSSGSEAMTTRIPGSADLGQQPTQRVTPQIWAARVPIRPDDVAPVREPVPPEWEQPEEEPQPAEPGSAESRPAVHPAVLGLVIVVLLAMLGTGLWLIFHRSTATPVSVPSLPPVASAPPTPADTATAADTGTPTQQPTPTAPTPTGVPTTAPATATQAPAPPPPPSSPALVAVPDGLVGLRVQDAERRLTAAGLTYTVVGLRAGKVTATSPESGTTVPRGSQVTLVVGLSSPSPTAKTPALE